MKEKLIELIDKVKQEYANDVTDCTETEYIAECLLSEDIKITIDSKWINYHNKKPNKNGYYLCYHMTSKCGSNEKWKREILYWEDNVWLYDANCFKIADFVNYWMPLPEPPHVVMQDIRKYYDNNNE